LSFVGHCDKNKGTLLGLGEEGLSLDDGTRIIFIVEGIMGSTGSIDTQIVVSQLLFTSNAGGPGKGHKYEERYEKIVKGLREVKNRTVQIFVNFGSSQSRCNRGFDILV